jgi:hypothetical protein
MFFDGNYLHYLTNPSQMDDELEYGFYGCLGVAAVAGTIATGGIASQGFIQAMPNFVYAFARTGMAVSARFGTFVYGGTGAGAGAGAQLTTNSCGPECARRLLSQHGISAFVSNLTSGWYKGLSPDALANNLNKFMPGWRGGYTGQVTAGQLSSLLSKSGNFVARLGGNPGHFVTVEGIQGGIVRYWDPATQTIRTMSVGDFAYLVTGVVHL